MTQDQIMKLVDAYAMAQYNQAFCDRYDEERRSAARAAVVAAIEALTKDAQADMFWNADDAETLYDSIDEFLNDEICNGSPLEVGDIRTIQRAIMLPKISIRITGINEEDCEADWEETAAQKEQV